MAKWADYLVVAVRYNAKRTHIDLVKVCADNGDTVGAETMQGRQWVVDKRERGTTFITAPPGENGTYKKGAFVDVIVVNREKYLRTDANNDPRDNLGNLPEF
jgi:hypothetical protein